MDLEAFREQSGLCIMPGMEVGTDLGHIGAFGLTEFVGGIHKAHQLRKVLDEVGGVMIALHPFRRHFDHGHNKYPMDITPEDAAELPLFQLCDAIEVLNGANTEPENELAYRVARVLNKPGTGGSDAHSMHGLGNYSTQFQRIVASVQELIDEIKAGRVRPSLRLPTGQFARYPEDVWEADVL